MGGLSYFIPGGGDATLGNLLESPNKLLNNLSGKSALELNKQQFREQMDFAKEQWNKEIEMANTAHQREVADLKAAGLNPVLTTTGGQGAGTTQSVHMPGIPDNGHMQRGLGAILNAVMSIAPQIAQMKNANSAMKAADAQSKIADAQSTKLLAEAGKLATEKDINNFIIKMRKYESENYTRWYESQISKSPYWFIEQIKNMFNAGGKTSAAKFFDKFGENQFYNLLNSSEKPKNSLSYSKGEKLVGLFLQLMGAL